MPSAQGFLNAVFENITRRTEQQQFLAAILSGAPSIIADHNSGGTPQLKRSEENVAAWLTCRSVLLRSFFSVQKRTEAMAAFIFILCIGLFAAVAVPALTSEERVPLHGNAFLILLAATLIILLGSFAVSMSVVGDKFNHLAAVHVRELAKVGIYSTQIDSSAALNDPTGLGRGNLATSVLVAQELVRATQEVEPLSILGLIELNVGAAKAVLFFMTIDLGIVFSRIDWSA
eukprot:SAG31_NODE_5322_length_2610_cov_1.405814_3_plen_231_part_00